MTSIKKTIPLLILSIVLLGAGGEEGPGERTELLSQQQKLQKQISALKHEQSYLEYRKGMYAADSKYLTFDFVAKRARFWYKNRLLSDFTFTPSKNFSRHRPKAGMITLTQKVEGKNDRHTLVFGDALLVRWKWSDVPPELAGMPSLTVTKKQLLSLYNAVETGATAYVER